MITKKEQNKQNKQILNEIKLYKHWTNRTYENVSQAVQYYTYIHHKGMQNLIQEAEHEEEEGILLKHRKLKQRLVTFQLYLQEEKKLKQSSISTLMSNIKSVYRFYEIQIPRTPQLQVQYNENINDLPTREHIIEALRIASTKIRALITFMASSGTARNEAANITIEDFITATKEYHNETDIAKIIEQLKGNKTIIPIFEITRIKTNKPYYTFCSNEATQYILQMLQERILEKTVNPSDKLFELAPISITKNFSRINDKCNMGWKGSRRFFHPHALRKFFSTQMYAEGLDFVSIEFMLGHSIGATQEAYIKANPEKQRQKYMRFVERVTFFERVNYIDITHREKRELEELRRENSETRERLRQLEEMVDLLRKI